MSCRRRSTITSDNEVQVSLHSCCVIVIVIIIIIIIIIVIIIIMYIVTSLSQFSKLALVGSGSLPGIKLIQPSIFHKIFHKEVQSSGTAEVMVSPGIFSRFLS